MARRSTYRSNKGTALTADGNYTLKAGPNDEFDWQGGNGAIFACGTWGNGTLKLQILAPDGSTWVNVGSPTTFTADGVAAFQAPAGQLRVVLSGSTGASLNAWVVGIPLNTAG